MSADKSLHVPDADDHPVRKDGRKDRSGAGTRAQILAAAIELAKEKGAAHISIEAIARRAGLSKGGLLYHFPKKDELVQALVEKHMADVDALFAEVEKASGQRRTNAIGRAIVDLARDKICQHKAELDGVFMALAENPHLLAPVRAYEKRVAERIRRTASDHELSLIALLAVEGMRSLRLFDADPLTAEESSAVLNRLMRLLADDPSA